MSVEQAKEFREKINNDPALQRELMSTVQTGETLDLVAQGQQHGYSFTPDEADQALGASANDDELTDFELELVAAASAAICQADKV